MHGGHPILTNTLSLPNLGESQKVRMDDSIESTNQLQKKEKLTKLETKIEVEVNSEKLEMEILKLTTPDGKDTKNNVEVDGLFSLLRKVNGKLVEIIPDLLHISPNWFPFCISSGLC